MALKMKIFRKQDILKTLEMIKSRRFPTFLKLAAHLVGQKPIKGFDKVKVYFYAKNGLEIGGPSFIFSSKSILPIYEIANNIDNCNFSHQTIWEGKIREGLTFNYTRNRLGHQFIFECTDLKGIKSASYDFVISSHVIEHTANPLKALLEWKRVLKRGGVMLLVLPHKEGTFDHNRPATRIDHLIEDFKKNVDERDLSHLPEILNLHDLSMDLQAGTFENFCERSINNFKNRCLHHHVFVAESVVQMIDYVGLKIIFLTTHPPYHIITLCQKTTNQEIEIHSSNNP